MTRSRIAAVSVVAVLILSGCAAGQAPISSSSPASSEGDPSASASPDEPFTAISYPEAGPAPCGEAPYTGEFSEITAIDAHTVEFRLCYPDVAFQSKAAFIAFGINDTAWLEEHVPDGSIVDMPNGTGPYRLGEWIRGDNLTLVANESYWGEPPATPTVIFRWSAESAQRLVELQSGTVDGIDNVGPTEFGTVEDDPQLQLHIREGLNTFYLGMNNTFEPWDNDLVRQAVGIGIDRERIVDNFYPPGSEVASHFTPCAIEGGCEGAAWDDFNPEAARELLAEAGYPDGFATKIQYRDVVRGYLPDPNIVAQEIQAQLKANLNIEATIEVQESGTFIDNNNAGNLDGLFLLGWGADFPDPSNFLDYHFAFGSGAKHGDIWEDIAEAIAEGGSTADQAARNEAYGRANDLIKEHVPVVPIAHGGSATAFLADVTGAHASPLTNEQFRGMAAEGRDQLVWMQNAEPLGLYCADESDGETLRACEQIHDALYSYEVGGTAVEPALAEECSPNEDLTVWTCSLRQGVTFHDGSAFDANDVVMSYAVQWDAEHPLHAGREGLFTYFPGLWGGFLNPALAEE